MEVRVGPAYYTTQFSGSKRKKILKTDTFQYVPVEDTLKKLLQLPDVVGEIDNFHGSDSNRLNDMCDGSVFKNHPIFKFDKQEIQLNAYYDEVELCNPLGSYTKKHKIGCLFFTVGNIHPKYRSQLKCIFVSTLGSNTVIRKHGLNQFLQPFVSSVQSLVKNGLDISIKNEIRHFNVSLLAFLADTLAAHALGGFKESMSFAHRICRSCMATSEQIQFNFLESDFQLRTPEEHEVQVQSLAGPSSSTNSTKFGINRASELAKIPHFSVASNLPHDIMHDLFEGVVPCEIKLLLLHLIQSKYLTISVFNDRLRQFDFGYTEICDKPSELDQNIPKKPEQKIRQSASQMWLLAIILPLLIGDLVPDDSKVWALYHILLRM